MMRIPPKIRTYCPHCNKHTEHEVSVQKKRPARALSWGQRQFARIMKGYGSQPRSEQREFAKTCKKVALVLKCTECKKAHQREGFRSKKFEIKA
jgi:large subunit ribosomal protein L44e